jgi:hypothetical protein
MQKQHGTTVENMRGEKSHVLLQSLVRRDAIRLLVVDASEAFLQRNERVPAHA